MIFSLHKTLFNLFKDNVREAFEYVENANDDYETVSFMIKNEDVQEVLLLINDEIVLHGMNNQDTVNNLGIKLYKLYDEILHQKSNQ